MERIMFNPLDVALHAHTDTHKRKVQEEIDSKKKAESIAAATSVINGASITHCRTYENASRRLLNTHQENT
jgi:hypothetical protein